MQLQWVKSKAGTWLEFQTFDISSVKALGVYMIWHGGDPGQVVYVGQGDIKDRLCFHRQSKKILQYAPNGLWVTWASVAAPGDRDGIERYLADTWHPLVGDAHPVAFPIAVNSPW